MNTLPATSGLEHVVGIVLRTGWISSTALLAVGLGLTLMSPSSAAGRGLTSAGLMILIATPVARVVASVIGYATERDWVFLALTATVLVILLGSLVVALTD